LDELGKINLGDMSPKEINLYDKLWDKGSKQLMLDNVCEGRFPK